jgi:hypothetical protein
MTVFSYSNFRHFTSIQFYFNSLEKPAGSARGEPAAGQAAHVTKRFALGANKQPPAPRWRLLGNV